MIPYEVRQEIIRRGGTCLVARFSGGNDEGGVDDLRLLNGDAEVEDIDPNSAYGDYEWDEKLQRYNEDESKVDKLAEFAVGVVEGRYSFTGDGYVNGKVTIDTTTGKIAWSVDQSVMSHFHEEW